MTKRARLITVTVHFPFWLNWVKRFMRVELKKIYMPTKIRGQTVDTIILDEGTVCQKL